MLESKDQYFMFPAGEVHCKIQPKFKLNSYVLVTPPHGTSLNDYLMMVIMTASVGEERGDLEPGKYDIYLPYLPYSRQDRLTSINEPFSLKVLGDLLGTLKYRHLYSFDVHSDVAFGCIRGFRNFSVETILSTKAAERLTKRFKDLTLIVPDQGAYKRLSNLMTQFQSVAFGLKTRDTKTGFLTLDRIISQDSLEGKDVIIIDDICDGGRTFTLLADKLYKMDANSVTLYVTHGFFTKGLEPLFDAGIAEVFTTDTTNSLNVGATRLQGADKRYHVLPVVADGFVG